MNESWKVERATHSIKKKCFSKCVFCRAHKKKLSEEQSLMRMKILNFCFIAMFCVANFSLCSHWASLQQFNLPPFSHSSLEQLFFFSSQNKNNAMFYGCCVYSSLTDGISVWVFLLFGRIFRHSWCIRRTKEMQLEVAISYKLNQNSRVNNCKLQNNENYIVAGWWLNSIEMERSSVALFNNELFRWSIKVDDEEFIGQKWYWYLSINLTIRICDVTQNDIVKYKFSFSFFLACSVLNEYQNHQHSVLVSVLTNTLLGTVLS